MTWRQVARTTYDHSRVSHTDGTVLDVSDVLKVELKGDNVQHFDTRWDETIIAMTEKPDDEVLENLYFKQLDTAEQLKQLLAFHIQDIGQKTEPKNYTELNTTCCWLDGADDTRLTLSIS